MVVGISGASGMPYALRLLEVLAEKGVEVEVILSDEAKYILDREGGSLDRIRERTRNAWSNSDFHAPMASGTHGFGAYVVIPCSTSSLAKIAHGIGDTLITRTGSVALKEGRRMILVPRETPLSVPTLEAMTRLAELGAVILPPCPPFYMGPTSIQDIVDYVAGKVLDHVGIEHELYRPWGED